MFEVKMTLLAKCRNLVFCERAKADGWTCHLVPESGMRDKERTEKNEVGVRHHKRGIERPEKQERKALLRKLFVQTKVCLSSYLPGIWVA